MSQQQDDAEFTALQTEIKQAYHQQSMEQPSAELDEAILAKARAARHVVAKQSGVTKSLWQRNAWLFSTAASVILVAGLFILNPSLQQQVGINLEQGLPEQQMDAQQFDVENVMSKSSSETIRNAAVEQSIVVEGMSMRTASPKLEQASPASVSDEALIDNTLTGKMQMQEASQQALVESQKQAKAAKQATAAEAAQLKAAALPIRQQEKEFKLMKQQLESNPKGHIELDTAEVAFARLQALMADNKIKQAEGYMITMEQRFPELLSPVHPLYEQYQKIKAQLTSQ
ncbi:hypothetical protein GCM10009347_05550 [Shewanella algicola]|uniref:Uncharacterized protein n=1 Tax=Shewanella algicola TaxID=640633 RepID=A0A9X2CCJ4_9GAMM|nr:hypothetical protein [Shewanella algicola]MCL1104187.1 hypothetical protein [Shewanella algicola]GGP40794.1 hypothetical protein GCM10009347_05550 [Shewanella algicola]